MRILFLDIDGVLLPGRANWLPTQTKPIHTVFDPCAVAIVNRICKDTGAQIVIHSSWVRSMALVSAHCEGQPATVKEHMINQGINPQYFHEDDICPWKMSGDRWNAIYSWLNSHHDVDSWVAVDDEPCTDPDYMLETHPGGLFVWTNFDDGITMNDYDNIISHYRER